MLERQHEHKVELCLLITIQVAVLHEKVKEFSDGVEVAVIKLEIVGSN